MTTGFICTYNRGKERESIKEILSTLKIIILKLKITSKTENNNEQNFRIKDLKNVKNHFLIENLTEFEAMKIFAELKPGTFKFTQRIYPIQFISSTKHLENLKNFFEHKKIEGSFKIDYKATCSDLNLKEEIFQQILELNKENKVNLKEPENIFIIRAIKNYLCFSVIEQKDKQTNFNFNKENF